MLQKRIEGHDEQPSSRSSHRKNGDSHWHAVYNEKQRNGSAKHDANRYDERCRGQRDKASGSKRADNDADRDGRLEVGRTVKREPEMFGCPLEDNELESRSYAPDDGCRCKGQASFRIGPQP